MNKQSQNDWRNWSRRWFHWISTPKQLPENIIEQQQATQLSILLFGLACATIINLLFWLLHGDISFFTIIGLIFSLSLYASSRYFNFKAVALATSLIALILPFAVYGFAPNELSIVSVIFLMTIALLVASQFLSLIANLQIAILVVISTFVLSNFAVADSGISISNLLIPTLIIIFLSVLNAYGREQINARVERSENPRDPQFLSHVLQLLPDPAIIHIDNQIIDLNKAASRLLESDETSLIGQAITEFISTDPPINSKVDKSAGSLTIHYDDRLALPDNKGWCNVNVTARSITYADQLAILMILRPNQIEQENRLFRNIIDSSFVPILVTDANFNDGLLMVLVNPAMCKQTQYEATALIGQPIRILYQANTEYILAELSSHLKTTTEPYFLQTELFNRDGTSERVTWIIRPIFDNREHITHFVFAKRINNELAPAQLHNSLGEHETTFRLMADLLSDYAYALEVSDEEHPRFLWLAGDYQSKVGLPYKEILQLEDWNPIIHEDDLPFYELRMKSLLKGETRTLEYRVIHSNGSIRWIHDTAHPILDEATGRVIRILGAANDVTDRIQAQETLKTHVVQQAVVAELGLLALNTNNHKQITQHVAVLCEQVLSIGFVAIMEYHAEDNQFVCVSLSRPDMPLRINDVIEDDYLNSLAGYTLHAQEAIISEDLADEPRFKPLAQIMDAQYGSAVGIMILGNDNQPYGVLTVYSKFTHDFSHDEVYFLQSVANVLGTFIERNRAQSAEREQAEYAEALRNATAVINSRLELHEVLSKIMSFVQSVVPQANQAVIMLRDDDTGLYHHYITWGYENDVIETDLRYAFSLDDFPTLKQMTELGQALLITDTKNHELWKKRDFTSQVRSYLGAPIIVEGETIGFINLDAFEPNAFNEEDAKRLKTFAETTSTAIVNAQKQEDLERKVILRTAELKQQSEQLETILAGTGDGIFYTENEHIAFVNEAFCNLTGYRAEEIQNQPITILQPDDITQQEVNKLRSITETVLNGEVWRDTVRLRRKDASFFEAGLTTSRVETPEPGALRAVTIVRDISKERELEELKKTFIAAAAHDLRSPITSLQMRMHMIKRQPEEMDYHMERLKIIIDRMNRLVNDLLDAHGRIVLRPQNIILQDVVDRVVDILSLEVEEKGISVNYQSPAEPISILADIHRLEQVFYNLITNASNYTDIGGQITVAYRIDSIAQQVEIDISDTGIGIPAEDQENIFLPFYRVKDTHRKGNGLGLSITREIVNLHDGDIRVSSVVGMGSTFTIILPLLPTE